MNNRDVIRDGGSAVDAAIATLICNGVYHPQSLGIGGGFFMVVYSREEGKVDTLISREQAPHYAHKDMFEDDPDMAATGIEKKYPPSSRICIDIHSVYPLFTLLVNCMPFPTYFDIFPYGDSS